MTKKKAVPAPDLSFMEPAKEAPVVITGGIKMVVEKGVGVVQAGSEVYGPDDTFICKGGAGTPGLTKATTDEQECRRLETLGIARRA